MLTKCLCFKDSSNKELELGVTSVGLVVFQNGVKVNTFSWGKIVKISFKRKQFFIQLRREQVSLVCIYQFMNHTIFYKLNKMDDGVDDDNSVIYVSTHTIIHVVKFIKNC
jgi:hypothetical protein